MFEFLLGTLIVAVGLVLIVYGFSHIIRTLSQSIQEADKDKEERLRQDFVTPKSNRLGEAKPITVPKVSKLSKSTTKIRKKRRRNAPRSTRRRRGEDADINVFDPGNISSPLNPDTRLIPVDTTQYTPEDFSGRGGDSGGGGSSGSWESNDRSTGSDSSSDSSSSNSSSSND
jgi:hypothetical protein